MYIFVKIFFVLPHDSVHLRHQRTRRCCIKMFKTCNRIHVPARPQGQQLSTCIYLSPLIRIKTEETKYFYISYFSHLEIRAPSKQTLNPLKLNQFDPVPLPPPPAPLFSPCILSKLSLLVGRRDQNVYKNLGPRNPLFRFFA